MPNTAVKQKTSQKAKADSRSPFENGDISMPVDSNDDSDMDVDVKVKGVKEKKVREKDDAERKLERMLFGDDEGFVGALKSHQSRDLVAFGEESDVESASEGEEEEAEDSDLAGVSDADVRRLIYSFWGFVC